MKLLSNGIGMLLICALAWPATRASAAGGCPFDSPRASFNVDYTSQADREKYLPIVERAHFTPRVRNLIGGSSGAKPGPDINYTIDHFPNHHDALDAASRLSLKDKTTKPFGLRCTVDGFFERAVQFKPSDGRLRMVYGMHFYRFNKLEKAIEQFEEADKLSPGDPNLAYNLGLIYVDLKQYDKAMAFAEKAYTSGFPLDGLKKKLKQVGKWVEPKPVAPQNEETKPNKPIATESKPSKSN
ncbi:MAG TPA: tetratricopeptide repeat protein [Burkholderiales bacterium]|nr:tetratricopeptide repeat protein [Burkholderiales bacterium]